MDCLSPRSGWQDGVRLKGAGSPGSGALAARMPQKPGPLGRHTATWLSS